MPYQPNLYVHREAFFEELQFWFSDSSPEYRLRSLVGAPGVGKSWAMAYVYHKLCQEGCMPIWLDLSRSAVYPGSLNSGENPLPFSDIRTNVGRQQWLRWVMEQVQEICPEITPFNPTIAFNNMFARFVEDLCQRCGSHTPILLVDGYDEVESDEIRDYLQEHIFVTFWQQECTRILIAQRDEAGFPHPVLSWNEEVCPLPGFIDKEERQEQIKKLQREYPVQLDILDALEPYLSTIPLINHLLFERAVEQHPNPLNKDDFQHCVDELVKRADISSESERILYIIAQKLDENWTQIELKEKTSIMLGDNNLEQLFETGLVHHITGTARYQIDEGLRSLLQQTQDL